MTSEEGALLLSDLVGYMSAALTPLTPNTTLAFTHPSSDGFEGGHKVMDGIGHGRVVYVRQPHYRSQFMMVWDEDGLSADFMNKASELDLFTGQQEWLVLLPHNTSLAHFIQALPQAHIFVDSLVLVGSYEAGWEGEGETEGRWVLEEVWRVGEGGEWRSSKWGWWGRVRGLRFTPLPNKYDRRKDLFGYHLRVATIKTMPYESLKAEGQPQNFGEGYVVDVWHTLQQQLNFTYTATNTLFGSLQQDGVTWNGMVGMLQRQTADVAVAPLSITQIRSITIDFTIPIQIVSTRLYIKRPVLEGTWTLYGQPFDSFLWLSIPVSIIICVISLWGFNLVSEKAGGNSHHISLADAFWIIFSGVIQQSTVIEPKPMSGKLVFFSGLWMGLILLTCYSAMLVSILTTRQPQLPFKDFQELLQNPDWNLGVRTNTALADSLALAPTNSPMKLSWEKFVGKDPINNLPSNNDDALASVLKGKYAFFANKEYIIYRLQTQLPLAQAMDIVDTRTDFLRRGIGFGLQKRSPYRNLINHVLSKMTQKGHLNRLKRKWWPEIDREPEGQYPTPGFNEVVPRPVFL
ncbi:hypothetical protein Pcinc_018677 [Petrolisthes cinctipes]|uniref:Uncharacterized protein n=1 Tax=Petrolisthes cinctipes TaxID=88211 RepID=A0AAE1KLD2_PETCI|nr:hypothetical protein Pcinc_018677 [Petrolisthes cinctipes]